ncbi:unnamed protein product [Periconia digitata]|uniref:Cerato-platanin n=1 Tax=Periconia digitata TaxID=1303443 RepID=A0A9W4UFY4_9PLEO|nr:unnamed protein product [Periconia digitata]
MLLLILTLTLLVVCTHASNGAVWATPHDSYSSSIGVLGCKINTNRVAYWPSPVDCTNFCISLSYQGRSVKLLRIDQSGGAHDVSYDAWNYLYTGYAATDKPAAGGPVAMEYQDLAPEECRDLIHTPDGKMPLSASNSMNFVASCLAQQGSWVGGHHALYNIIDSVCTMGFDEQCSLDLSVSNQPKCSHTLGLQDKLLSQPVYNIRYPTGVVMEAGTGQVVPPSTVSGSVGPNADKGGGLSSGAKAGVAVGVVFGVLALAAVAGFWWWKKRRDTPAQEPTETTRENSGVSIAEEIVVVSLVDKRLDRKPIHISKETL